MQKGNGTPAQSCRNAGSASLVRSVSVFERSRARAGDKVKKIGWQAEDPEEARSMQGSFIEYLLCLEPGLRGTTALAHFGQTYRPV